MYHFTNKLPKMICRICGKQFSKEWSNGGVGAVCKDCNYIRKNLNLIELGIVRNIIKIPNKAYEPGYSFEFEVNIDDKWYECTGPSGDWSIVKEYNKHGIFSVDVGWWELNRLYKEKK